MKPDTPVSQQFDTSKKKPFLTKRKFIIIVIIIIVLIGALLTSFVLLHKKSSSTQLPTNSSKTSSTATASDQVAAATQSAQDLVATQGTGAAQASLDTALKTASTNADKSYIYSTKAEIASTDSSQSTGSDTSSAVQYAVMADNLNPTPSSADYVGRLEQAAGNNSDAIKYFNLAASRLGDVVQQDPDSNAAADYNHYISEAKALSS